MTRPGPQRVLVVGHGSIARKHLTVLERLLPDAAKAIWMPHRPPAAGEPAFVRSLDEVDAFAPDIAVIASPASEHVAQARELLRRGVGVVIEKPLSDRPDDALALAREADSSTGIAMVAYPMRFYAPVESLRRAVADGGVGVVESLHLRSTSYLPDWRPGVDFRRTASARRELGGGALREVSHELDLLVWIAGMPRAVASDLAQSPGLGLDVETSVRLLARYDAGTRASVHLDIADRALSREVRVVGSDATLVWSLADHAVRRYDATGAVVVYQGSDADWGAMYENEIAYFLDCYARGTSPEPGIDDGVRVMKIIGAAQRSATSGNWEQP